MNVATEPGTALALPEPTALKDLFRKPEGIDAILARIKADAMAQAKALDPANKKDRAALTSLAFKVAQSKTALDAAGKDLNEDRRKIIDAVDAQRRVIRETLDKVRDEIKAPVLKWEADETARVAAIRARMHSAFQSPVGVASSNDLIDLRATVAAVPMDATWAEMLGEAEVAKILRLEALDRAIDAAIEREEQAAELAKLRAEAAAQAEADRLAREAEAAEAAEAKRLADAEAERSRIAQAAAAAAQQKAEQEAADLRSQLADLQEREAQAKLVEEARAAREAAAIEQAKRDEADRIAAEQAAAEFQAAMAAKAESRRVEAIEEIEEDLCDVARLDTETLNQIVNALLMGKIRNVQVVL